MVKTNVSLAIIECMLLTSKQHRKERKILFVFLLLFKIMCIHNNTFIQFWFHTGTTCIIIIIIKYITYMHLFVTNLSFLLFSNEYDMKDESLWKRHVQYKGYDCTSYHKHFRQIMKAWRGSLKFLCLVNYGTNLQDINSKIYMLWCTYYFDQFKFHTI